MKKNFGGKDRRIVDDWSADRLWQLLRRHDGYRNSVSIFLKSARRADDKYAINLYKLLASANTKGTLCSIKTRGFEHRLELLSDRTLNKHFALVIHSGAPGAFSPKSPHVQNFLKEWGSVLSFPLAPRQESPAIGFFNAIWNLRPVKILTEEEVVLKDLGVKGMYDGGLIYVAINPLLPEENIQRALTSLVAREQIKLLAKSKLEMRNTEKALFTGKRNNWSLFPVQLDAWDASKYNSRNPRAIDRSWQKVMQIVNKKNSIGLNRKTVQEHADKIETLIREFDKIKKRQ